MNNPLRYTDPTGHVAAAAVLGWAFTTVGVTVSAPAIAAILGAVALGAAIGCVANDRCRAGLLNIIGRGTEAIQAFIARYGEDDKIRGGIFDRNMVPTCNTYANL